MWLYECPYVCMYVYEISIYHTSQNLLHFLLSECTYMKSKVKCHKLYTYVHTHIHVHRRRKRKGKENKTSVLQVTKIRKQNATDFSPAKCQRSEKESEVFLSLIFALSVCLAISALKAQLSEIQPNPWYLLRYRNVNFRGGPS